LQFTKDFDWKPNMSTIAVTGGSGFIGSWIVDELINRGHSVVILDHSKRESNSKAEVFLGDVRDSTAIHELAAHVDGIIHLAAVLGTQETIGNPGPAVEINMLGGVNALSACRQYGIPLVYAGVGNYWMLNTYSTTKTAVERLLFQFRDEFGLPFATVRPVNAYGPRQRVAPPFGPGKVKKIMPAFVCRALTGSNLEVYGQGDQISDMVFVGDVAKVFVQTMEYLLRGSVPRFPIEVGPEDHLTVLQVARKVQEIAQEITGLSSEIEFLPMRPGEKKSNDISPEVLERLLRQLGDTEDDLAIKRKLRELGVKVTADKTTLNQIGISVNDFVPFEVGARMTVEWFKDNHGVTWNNPKV
jgi:UDP-glucose 4-epimerase